MQSETLKGALDVAIRENNQRAVTVLRGRLIKEYQKEIRTLLKDTDISEEEKQKLVELREIIQEEIRKHKLQLSARYKNEFIDKKAKIPSLITILPKALVLAVKKVKACIDNVKTAENNKDRLKKGIDVLKSVGMVAATPVIYLGKFAIDQWYLLAGLGSYAYFKENPLKLFNLIGNNPQDIIKSVSGFSR